MHGRALHVSQAGMQGRRSPRSSRWRRCLVAAAVTLPLLGFVPEAQAESPSTANAIPEPVAAVAMGCGSGQLDVNTATVPQLVASLRVGRPVAQRLTAARPYLRLDPDLLVVQGIGRSDLDRILREGQACAAPPTLPPPVFDVCVSGDGRIDLNRPANRDDLAGMFGGPTADRIVGNIPYWRVDLSLAELDPGVARPKVERNRDRLCVTPPTIDFNGTRWGWIDPNAGGLVRTQDELGAYQLAVPGGVVAGTGAWGSVTPNEAPFELDAPSADFHIHGPWAGVVRVTLPRDHVPAVDPGTWTNVVVHTPDGHDFASSEIRALEAVTVGSDGVTTDLTSLSTSFSLTVPLRTISAPTATPQGAALSQLVRLFFGTGAARPTCDPSIPDGVAADGRRIATEGQPASSLPGYTTPTLWHCIRDEGGDTETWRFAVNRSAAFIVRENGGTADVKHVSGGGALLAFATTTLWNNSAVNDGPGGRTPIAVTGSSIEIGVAPDGGTVDVDFAAGRTFFFQALDNASDAIPSGVAKVISDVLVDCPEAITVWGLDYEGGAEAADAAVSLAGTLTDCMMSQLGDASALLTDVGGSDGLLRKFKRANAWLRAVDLTTRVVDALEGAIPNDPTITMVNVPAPPPNSPTHGGSPLPGGGLDGRLPSSSSITDAIVKLPGYHAELTYGGSRVGHAILDGNTYICLARRYPVRDWMFDDQYSQVILQNSVHSATCNSTLSEIALQPGSKNWILREGTGTAWLLDTTGHVRWIPDESTYICLSQRYWVLDWRTWEEITAFPWAPDGEHATCG